MIKSVQLLKRKQDVVFLGSGLAISFVRASRGRYHSRRLGYLEKKINVNEDTEKRKDEQRYKEMNWEIEAAPPL